MGLKAALILGFLFVQAGCTGQSNMSSWNVAPTTTPVKLTDAEIAIIQAGVRPRLKDPESARFGAVRASKGPDGTTYVCGMVNSKNSFGGYAGETPFAGTLANGRFTWVLEGGTANQEAESVALCQRYVPL